MAIERNVKAKIKFEGTSLVIEKAFQLDGVYHNIVLSDGNRALAKNNLKWAPENQICQEITDLYLACVERAMNPDDCGLQGPLENVRFVYKKDPNGTEGSLTRMFWRQQGDHPYDATFLIGTPKINYAMDMLKKNFSIYEVVKGGAKESPKSKPSSSAASSSSSSSSLIPDFLLGDSSDTPSSVKVAPPSGGTSSKPAKAKAPQGEEADASLVRVAAPLAADVERQVARRQQSLLDQHNAAQKVREVERVAGRFEKYFPALKTFVQLWDAVQRQKSPTVVAEEVE